MFGEVNSPARATLEYMTKIPDTGPSLYVGEPRLELDQAWSKLLRSSMIKLSKEEIRSMNATSIALRDGSGYIGYLESIHMLHCVKRMYQYRHQDHYQRLQDTDAFLPGHWDHCLEILREGIMCNADATINTYFWASKDDIKGYRSGPRKCTNWGLVQSWLSSREIDLGDREGFLASLVSVNEGEANSPY
ncbi:tat pathway signal sequence [Apiospora arundinis]|uniref:Tat pathway signal sequence n=1 Tax=Apiospora arundinis TaxID=335852 RepID=A0ABR2HZ09_9PEZI